MKAQDWFKNQINTLEKNPTYQAEVLQLKISEKILELIELRKMTRADLANHLKCSLPYISKLLNGSENMTIKKMTEIALALNCDLDIKIIPSESKSKNLFIIPIQPEKYNKTVHIDEANNGKGCDLSIAV